MAVTDLQVAALRAQLAGDMEEHLRLLAEVDKSADRDGYDALLAAAFFDAVERRFGDGPKRTTVISFVADLRSRSEAIRKSLPPDVAERMILSVVSDDNVEISDLDSETLYGGQIIILAGLIGDEELAPEGLEAFLVDARREADGMLDRRSS